MPAPLFKVDHAEQSVGISIRARGEKQLICFAVHSAALAKCQCPQSADAQGFVVSSLKLTHELSGRRVELIDAAVADIAHQQGVARRTKVLRRQRHAPGRLKVRILGEALDQFPTSGEYVDCALAERIVREGYVQFAVDVLNVVNNQPGKLRVREMANQVEFAIINVNLIAEIVGAKQEVGTVVYPYGQSRIPGVCVDYDHGRGRVHGWVPAADCAGFKRGENKGSGSGISALRHHEIGSAVGHLSGDAIWHRVASRRDADLSRFHTLAVVKSRNPSAIVADPKRTP